MRGDADTPVDVSNSAKLKNAKATPSPITTGAMATQAPTLEHLRPAPDGGDPGPRNLRQAQLRH